MIDRQIRCSLRRSPGYAEGDTMNVIVEKRLAGLKRELRAVPDAMRWLLGISK